MPELTPADRQLIREGLLIEYAPGHLAAADLTVTPSFRAVHFAPLLGDATLVNLSAMWVYTGWWPPSKPVSLCIAHPTRTGAAVTERSAIPARSQTVIGGISIATPAKTAVDLLLQESVEIATQAIFILLNEHLTIDALDEEISRHRGRWQIQRARRISHDLREYTVHLRRLELTYRDENLLTAARTRHAISIKDAFDLPQFA